MGLPSALITERDALVAEQADPALLHGLAGAKN
jgi:hypothetical protein